MMSFVTQVAVRQDDSGRYEFATGNRRWSYEYTVSALGTRSEKRAGVLQLDGQEIAGKPGVGVRTPWGLMQRFDAAYEVGWLLEGTYGRPIAPVGRVDLPADAFGANGEWHAVIMPWQYRLQTLAMGSKSETRSGRLFYERGVVEADAEGTRVETPWGVMWWLGKPHDEPVIVPGDYEAGWLLRGTFDHAFELDGPFIQPGEPAGSEGLIVYESMYLAESVLGHSVSLSVPKQPVTSWRGSLNLDPNICQLNEFGDRTGCTKIAIRHFDVEVTQLRLADPLHLGRRIFRVEGADGQDLPAPIALIADARFQRFYLKTDRDLIPLFPRIAR